MKKWSRLQIATHILAPMPLVILVIAYFTGNLTINPIQTATQRSGDIAIVMLLLTLACTPIHTIFNIPGLLKLRRPLGLYTFFYASLHMLTYTGWDYGFNFNLIASEFSEKRYLIVGFTALSLLIPLALTSHNWWKKKLGKTWKKLHRLIYLAAGLVVLHVSWAVKGDLLTLQGDIWKPLAAGIVLSLLLAARIPPLRKSLSKLRYRKAARPKSVQPKKNPSPEETA
jgi:methionine sulfoxide reductase heme-binding subunit